MTRPPVPGRLVLPNARALSIPDTPYQNEGTRASRRVLAAFGFLLAVSTVAAATVPLTRTVALVGHLAPRRTVVVRAAESGLLTHTLVQAGDIVRPRQRLARLDSPGLADALRTRPPGTPAQPLLDRLARLDLHAPPWSTPLPDGAADPASIFHGGLVLTEDLTVRSGTLLAAGDTLLTLAVTDADGRVPLCVHAVADEHAAHRIHPGQAARITLSAMSADQPRQITGRVLRVSPAPTRPGGWHVEIDLTSTGPVRDGSLALQPGLTAQVAVVQRRETLLRTAARWIQTRSQPQYR